MRLTDAMDLWLGELARKGRAPTTRDKYRRDLWKLADMLPRANVEDVTPDDCRRFVDKWANKSKPTIAHKVTLLHGLFGWLYYEERIPSNPAERLQRPALAKPEDVEVVSVSTDDVTRMFDACDTWQELLCLSTACYLGPRRSAIARCRRCDLDLRAGTIRFLEKGGKVTVKPVPDEYLAILRAADDNGVWAGADDYLVPNRRPASVRSRERSSKVIWETIRGIAERAGVRSHVHALRAAFAVQFLEQHPGDLEALQVLLGHERLETTRVYLRRLDRGKVMERVRDLSWGSSVFPSSHSVAHTGFEPVLPLNQLSEPVRRKLAALTEETVSA